jgi:hypothetical protein
MFLVLSLLFEKGAVITGFVAALLSGTCAYVSLLLTIPNEMNIVSAANVTNASDFTVIGSLIPSQWYIGSVWLSVLCTGLFLIAALKAFFGYTSMMQEAGEEAEKEGEIGVGPPLEYSDGKSMKEISRRKSGLEGVFRGRLEK